MIIDPVLLTEQDNVNDGCSLYYKNENYIVANLSAGYPKCILEICSITGALMKTALVNPGTVKTDVQELYLYRLITPCKTLNVKFYKNEK